MPLPLRGHTAKVAVLLLAVVCGYYGPLTSPQSNADQSTQVQQLQMKLDQVEQEIHDLKQSPQRHADAASNKETTRDRQTSTELDQTGEIGLGDRRVLFLSGFPNPTVLAVGLRLV